MSKIDDLIKQYCPNGVEYDIIENICRISRGRVMSKEYLRDNIGEYPVYSSQTINEGMLGKIDTYDYDGEYLTWTTDGANAGSIFYRTGKFSITNVCGLLKVISDKVNTKFLHYYLGTVAKKYVNAGMGNPKLMSNVMATIKVAVPPLPVQEEVVRILDAFSSLEAELEAELEARKKQYEYYRNKLLTFDENTMRGGRIKFMQLNDVCKTICAGGDLPTNYIKAKMATSECPYPIYSNGTGESALYGYSDTYRIDEDAVSISARGTIGYHTIRNANFTPIVRLIILIPNKQHITTKYLNYALDITNITSSGGKIGGGIPQLTVPNVRKLVIPVPPLEEQERIVAILDKFDSLVNDISEGLPAELTARRQQYEYYRNKLLTFDEAA